MEKNDELKAVLQHADPNAVRAAMSALSELGKTAEGARLQRAAQNLTPADLAVMKQIISDPHAAQSLLQQKEIAARIEQLLRG